MSGILGDFTNTAFYQKQVKEGKPFKAEVDIDNSTLARFGITLVLSFSIIIMLYYLMKAISK